MASIISFLLNTGVSASNVILGMSGMQGIPSITRPTHFLYQKGLFPLPAAVLFPLPAAVLFPLCRSLSLHQLAPRFSSSQRQAESSPGLFWAQIALLSGFSFLPLYSVVLSHLIGPWFPISAVQLLGEMFEVKMLSPALKQNLWWPRSVCPPDRAVFIFDIGYGIHCPWLHCLWECYLVSFCTSSSPAFPKLPGACLILPPHAVSVCGH